MIIFAACVSSVLRLAGSIDWLPSSISAEALRLQLLW
jgi:hypothetical protein